MKFPLGMHDLVNVLPGAVVLVEGVKSSGKTAFAIDTTHLNQDLFPERVRYLNVEMSEGEIASHLKSWPPEIWSKERIKERVQFVKRFDQWWDLVQPDGMTVVDYVRDSLEAYKIAHYIELIHSKLKTGIALVLVQRDPRKDYGAGGSNIRSIPRLIISLKDHKCKIEDTKHFWRPNGDEPNPSGMVRGYKLVDGRKWIGNGDWHFEEESLGLPRRGPKDYV
jgi:hypothetical protein